MTSESSVDQTLDENVAEAPVNRPEVARRTKPARAWLGYGLIGVTGVVILVSMSAHRTADSSDDLIGSARAATVAFTAPQPLPSDAAIMSPAVPAFTSTSGPQFTTDNHMPDSNALPVTGDGGPMMPPQSGQPVGGVTRLNAPAVVVDLSAPSAAGGVGAPNGPALTSPTLTVAAKSSDDGAMNLVQHVAPSQDPAHAASIGRLSSIVSEGTVISATMETAINSDLPGFARAVIARDVMSFDGTRMLVPRGSRVLGQYKSGIAMGASRVFIIWTRLIRPDGVAVDLTSPGGDDLGRGGLGGRVDRHFLQRFGGSILMSVLNGAISLGTASLGSGLPVYINSVAEAGQAANSALGSRDIPPTIKTPQGASVKIFVARDLDFSGFEQVQ